MSKSVKLDPETINAIKELIQPIDVRPVMRKEDRDSFADFTGGLRQNWIFVMAMFSVGFWIITSIGGVKSTNENQDRGIEENAKAIINLNNSYNQLKDTVNTTNAEIIRKLDNLQKDVELIKAR